MRARAPVKQRSTICLDQCCTRRARDDPLEIESEFRDSASTRVRLFFLSFQPRAAAHEILTRSRSLDNEQRNELEAIIHDLEDENRLLQNEYERLCQQHMEKSLIINEQHQQFHHSDSQLGSLTLLNDYNSSDREMLREAKQLRHHKTKLEQRMKILEEHNKQLEKQLKRSKQLLFREVRRPVCFLLSND